MHIGAAAGEPQIAGAIAGLVAVGPLEGDRRAQEADDFVGHRHVSGPSGVSAARGADLSSGAACSAWTKPPLSISASTSASGVRWTRDLLARLRRGGAERRHPLGEVGVGQVVLQRGVRRQRRPAATSARRRSRSPRAARGAPPPPATCPRDRSCRRAARSGPPDAVAVLADQHHLVRSVSATTLTQGGYSLIQYSGIIVPFGSSHAVDAHRVPELLRQVLAREDLPGAGIVGEVRAWSGIVSLRMMPRARANTAASWAPSACRCWCSGGWGGSSRAAPGSPPPRRGLAAVGEGGARAAGGRRGPPPGRRGRRRGRSCRARPPPGRGAGRAISAVRWRRQRAISPGVGLLSGGRAADRRQDVGVAQREAVVGAPRGRDVGEAFGVEARRRGSRPSRRR